VVGATWWKIQKLDVYAYFDRVESEANPVNGLSRGRMDGPWTQVIKAEPRRTRSNFLSSVDRNKQVMGASVARTATHTVRCGPTVNSS
jgi:hypothetical protein